MFIDLIRGDDRYVYFDFWSGSAPFDLTGVSARMTLRRTPSWSQLLVKSSATSGLELTTAPGSTIQNRLAVKIDKGDFTSLPNKLVGFYYDLELTFPDGSVQTPIIGEGVVKPDVSY
jgi:hypothetical protein